MTNNNTKQSRVADVPWYREQQKLWVTQIANNQIPHALLLSGSAGIGKRSLAEWKIEKFLRISPATEFPIHPHLDHEHADIHRVSPDDGKTSISVDQIRVLTEDLSKTSYLGVGKVAVIEPANTMTVNATNSLLKTLEEPSGNTLIILIVDRMQNIPATIKSRCQQLSINKPSMVDAIQWLKSANDTLCWDELPKHLIEHPLLALSKVEEFKKIPLFKQQFIELLHKKESPIQLAAKWSKEEPHFVMDWLANFVATLIYQSFGSRPSMGDESDILMLSKIDKFNLFIFLDTIYKLRNQPQGSYNLQMAYESLLVDWSMGLKFCNQDQVTFDRLPTNFFQSINR